MKRLLTLILAIFATSAFADGHGLRHHHGGYYRSAGDWVVPALIGGVIGYELNRPRPPVVYAPPVYAPQPQPYQLPPAPLGFHYEQVSDNYCNCWRYVIVPN